MMSFRLEASGRWQASCAAMGPRSSSPSAIEDLATAEGLVTPEDLVGAVEFNIAWVC